MCDRRKGQRDPDHNYRDLLWWDSRNEEGIGVGSGMYMIEVDAGGFRARRMAALVRF